MAANGYVTGRDKNIFAPNDNISREEFMAILIRSFGLLDSAAVSDFIDINKDEWYYGYVATAQKLGITKGKDDGSFGINENITREDMATVVYRTAEIAGLRFNGDTGYVEFEDGGDISDYALDAVRALSGNGIINGLPDGFFAPKEKSTRAMAAMMIYRLFQYEK
jgi:hypothetical protein